MPPFERAILGRTGLQVSRLGLGSSYAAPESSYDEAFERGVNYFYWGSMRRNTMGKTLRRLAPIHREKLVILLQSYARLGGLVVRSAESALRRLGIGYADVLLLGWYNRPPGRRIMEGAMRLVERGLVRHVAVSGHNRPMFPSLRDDPRIGIWHVRYNAVHRGAERDVFPSLDGLETTARPGVVTYTTTRWGHLCDPRRTPAGERTPTGTDCYRFALTDPHVDIALAGPDNPEQMTQALRALDLGPMTADELGWMRRVGDAIYRGDRTSRVRD